MLSNSCNIYQVQNEWDRLKNHIRYILQNNLKTTNLKIWGKIFTNSTILEECKTVLHIFQILLVTPFTIVKVGQVFSCMNWIKTDWRNRLGQKRLDNLMIITEEGPPAEDFTQSMQLMLDTAKNVTSWR